MNRAHERQAPAPDNTAARVALWRALHVLADAAPHVLDDTVGLQLLSPDPSWRERPDMDLRFTRLFRASIIARARYIEDWVLAEAASGVTQYVILGAGLDTFAQRYPALPLRIFEVDQPQAQAWKKQALIDRGYGVPDRLHLVGVDFEAGDHWWDRLRAAGFKDDEPAVIVSTGVSMYLTEAANRTTLRQVAGMASGTSLIMSFLLPIEQIDPDVRPGFEIAAQGARASGNPFISFFDPGQIIEMARQSGFAQARHMSSEMLARRYFAERTDGLRPPRGGEELLLAKTN